MPHWSSRYVFVTFRLADSLPLHALQEIKDYDALWLEKYATNWTEEVEVAYQRGRVVLSNELLDKALGSCILKRENVRLALIDAMMHFNEVRYRMHAYVIMPNHVHLLVETREHFRIQDVMHTIKSFSAKQINALTGSEGKVWARESYDRYIRDERHYEQVIRYIKKNPRHCIDGEYALYVKCRE